MPGVTGALVADVVPLPPGRVLFEPSWSAAAPALAQRARPGDLVLTMGAGDVSMVGPEVLEALRAQDGAARTRPGPVNRTGTTTRDRTGRSRRAAAERRPAAPVTPLVRRRRARPRRRSRRPIQLAVAVTGARRLGLAAPGQPGARAWARCRWTASRRCPPTRCGRPPASSRARRCCGSTSTPPGRGSPGCPRWRRSRSPAAGRTPSSSPWSSGCRSRSSANPGRRSLVDAEGRAVRHGHRGAAGGRRAARRGHARVRVTRRPWPRWRRSRPCPPTSAGTSSSAAATSAEDITLTLDRRHAGALGRPGGLRPQGRRAGGAARAARRRRPGAGRRRST